MTGPPAPRAPIDAVEQYVARIEAHRLRLAEGHDPLGHLFAIERLARCARVEWLTIERPGESGRARR